MSKLSEYTKAFYLVWKDGTIPNNRHKTKKSAYEEAERLIAKHGGEFHILRCEATIVSIGAQWMRRWENQEESNELP